MAIGDVTRAEAVDEDLWYVDTGMYDVPEYGSVYAIDGERPALVDAGIGTNYERVLDLLDAAGIAPEDLAAIALTHVHLDHAGGAGFLVEACPNATVYVHEVGARHVIDPGRLWAGTKAAVGDQLTYYVEPEPVPADRVAALTDGDAVDLGDRRLVARHAPGHAPHQVVYEAPAMDAVFAADAAGIYTPSTDEVHVTSPPPNFDLDVARDDVATIRELDPEWLLYAHFGPERTGNRLRNYAERLTEWVDEVAAKRGELGDDEAVIEHFQAAYDAPEAWGERKTRAEVSMNVRGVLNYLDDSEDAEAAD